MKGRNAMTPDHFARRMDRLCTEAGVVSGPIAIGLSGGGDSLALLLHMSQWAKARDRALHAIIVDHALRDESALEALEAAQHAGMMGASAHILRWSGPRPGQKAARDARHDLFAKACARLGVKLLCLGHTLDDQAETLWMRIIRGVDGKGLTGMTPLSPSPSWPLGRDLWIARPLLDQARDDLRDVLRQNKLKWAEDPSNDNGFYERVRARRSLKGFQDQGLDLVPLGEFADKNREPDNAARVEALSFTHRSVTVYNWGGFSLEPQAFARLSETAQTLLLEGVLLGVSGQRGPVPAPIIRAFRNRILQGEAGTGFGVHITEKGVIGRDPGAVSGRRDGMAGLIPFALGEGASGIWDGRFFVRAKTTLLVRPWKRQDDRDPENPLWGAEAKIPPALRQSLGVCVAEGENLQGVTSAQGPVADIEWLGWERLQRSLLCVHPLAWFDVV